MRYGRGVLLGVVVCVLAVGPAGAQCNTDFELPAGCALPFADIANVGSIDSYAGPAGSASSESGREQNRQKNNFCSTGTPTPLRLKDFKILQQRAIQAGIPFGNQGLPNDRGSLRALYSHDSGVKIGEGSVVQFVGYIDIAFEANLDDGESVNCKLPGAENNDIHIELGEKPSPSNCARVTAEISPHFRPKAWTANRLTLIRKQRLPIRLTGHLFFDASHAGCTAQGQGYRASSWEIHPVYRVEVCRSTSIDACRSSQQSLWTPLHIWKLPEWHNAAEAD